MVHEILVYGYFRVVIGHVRVLEFRLVLGFEKNSSSLSGLPSLVISYPLHLLRPHAFYGRTPLLGRR